MLDSVHSAVAIQGTLIRLPFHNDRLFHINLRHRLALSETATTGQGRRLHQSLRLAAVELYASI